MASLTELAPGTILAGDFRVERLMAEGGMGAVYVAEQLSTGKQRALKLMLRELVSDATLRKRFEQEARIASQIESEHVVEVVGAGVDPVTNLPWLAMELLHGEELAAVVTRRGALPVAEILGIFEQLCHALGAAHDKGIVHRDLKPENIFLAESKRAGGTVTIKVLDFGIAKMLAEAGTKHTAAMGSPMWMAPEQTEQAAITAATDVWALGLIAFHLLTGRYFWKVANTEEVTIPRLMREMLFEPIPEASLRAQELNPGAPFPPGFDAWFARCVARDQAARFVDARSAWLALHDVLGGGSAISLPTPSLPAVVSSARKTDPLTSSGDTLLATGPMPATLAPTNQTDPSRVASAGNRRAWIAALGAGVLLLGVAAFALESRAKRGASPTPSGDPSSDLEPPEAVIAPLDTSDSDSGTDDAVPSAIRLSKGAPSAHALPAPPHPSGSASPPEAPSFELKLGVPRVVGSLTPEVVRRVLRRGNEQYRLCFAAGLQSNPSLEGRVMVHFNVDSEGKLSSARDGGSALPDQAVVRCIVGVVSELSFPADGSSGAVVAPLLFSRP